jgi:hypothetical protein
MRSTLLAKPIGEPPGDEPDLLDRPSAVVGFDDNRLDFGTFGGIELAEHEGCQPRVVRVDIHDRLSSRSARDSAASPANN